MLGRLPKPIAGHGRVTVRDLLLLVGSVDEPDDHVEKIFGWIFTRESEFVKAAVAGFIVLVASVVAVLFKENVLGVSALIILAPLALAALAAGAFLVNRDISHLHREWLASVALLRRLEPFKACLRAYLLVNAEPNHDTYGNGPTDTETGLAEAFAAWRPTPSTRTTQVGRLLFDVLGPVATVHYEASDRVRNLAGEVVDEATELLLGRARGPGLAAPVTPPRR